MGKAISNLEKWTYVAGQSARVAWYAGHYAAINRIRGALTRPGDAPFQPSAPIPDMKSLVKEIRALFDRDLANIAHGFYRAPEMRDDPRRLIDKSLRFLLDARRVEARRQARRHKDVEPHEGSNIYPDYYLQNFHYQTDGWLSEGSAELYDTQVEVLFAGTADAMRRQALVPIAHYMNARDQRHVSLADIGCGTGRFLREVKRNWPRMQVTGLDLAPDYLEKTNRALKKWSRAQTVQAPAEALPFENGSQDVVTASYLFHELPPEVRSRTLREIVRVLNPGGQFILIDALQTGDRVALDGLLEFFPRAFHEPYFETYLAEDFAHHLKDDMSLISEASGYLTKIMCFEKNDVQR
ncbi:MAG: class I SAM-dependent methyltransferase [Parvibaculum sp.]